MHADKEYILRCDCTSAKNTTAECMQALRNIDNDLVEKFTNLHKEKQSKFNIEAKTAIVLRL